MVKKQQKNQQMLIIAVLSVVVLLMSIGFAGYTKQLQIAGAGGNGVSIPGVGKSWKVAWKAGSVTANESGSAGYKHPAYNTVSIGGDTIIPTISSTGTIVTLKAKLSAPGDVYSYRVIAQNTGEINANLSHITLSTLTPAEQRALDFYVWVGDQKYSASSDVTGVQLNTSSELPIIVTVEYKAGATAGDVPNDLSVNLDADFTFVQR